MDKQSTAAEDGQPGTFSIWPAICHGRKSNGVRVWSLIHDVKNFIQVYISQLPWHLSQTSRGNRLIQEFPVTAVSHNTPVMYVLHAGY